MKIKNHLNIALICLTVIISFLIISHNIKNRSRNNDTISVTGLGRMDFKSDLIVWNGHFGRSNKLLESAYKQLKRDQELIQKFLIDQGVKKEEIVFSSIDIDHIYKSLYNKEGEYIGQEFTHFELKQEVEIESKEVEKIEEVSRSITELINEGITIYSSSPQYYYTKLAELKLNLIEAATIDARLRADRIVVNAKAKIGDLYDARMGVFQIIEQNSSEELSWGGTFNTSSKMKTATITMKLTFGID